MNTKNKLKEKLIYLTSISTAHCIPKVSRPNRKCLKVMWLFITFVCICLCAYFAIVAFIEYLNYSTESLINIINEEEADFPSVSICSLLGILIN